MGIILLWVQQKDMLTFKPIWHLHVQKVYININLGTHSVHVGVATGLQL